MPSEPMTRAGHTRPIICNMVHVLVVVQVVDQQQHSRPDPTAGVITRIIYSWPSGELRQSIVAHKAWLAKGKGGWRGGLPKGGQSDAVPFNNSCAHFPIHFQRAAYQPLASPLYESGEWGTSYTLVAGRNSSTHYILETLPAKYFWTKFFPAFFWSGSRGWCRVELIPGHRINSREIRKALVNYFN